VPTRVAALSLIASLAGCEAADQSPGARQPPPFPGSVATTSWQVAEAPDGFGPTGDRFGSPSATLQALMTYGVQRDGGLPEGVRLAGDILDVGGDTASAFVQVIGNGDDSVAGQEIMLLMTRDARGWFIERLTYRNHCRRGLDPAGDCI
jgi:hypothetical protein